MEPPPEQGGDPRPRPKPRAPRDAAPRAAGQRELQSDLGEDVGVYLGRLRITLELRAEHLGSSLPLKPPSHQPPGTAASGSRLCSALPRHRHLSLTTTADAPLPSAPLRPRGRFTPPTPCKSPGGLTCKNTGFWQQSKQTPASPPRTLYYSLSLFGLM